MKQRQRRTKSDEKVRPWSTTQYSKLIRYVSSGVYYARFRIQGKLIWKSPKTDQVTVAQLRLADLEKEERKKGEKGRLLAKGRVLFEAALKAYEERGFRPRGATHQERRPPTQTGDDRLQ